MSEVNELKEYIKIAKDAVLDESEPYKIESFRIILAHLLSDGKSHSVGTKRKSSVKRNVDTTVQQTKMEISDDFNELATKCKITEEELKETISIKNDFIEIVKRIKGKEKFKHKICSLCILASYKILADVEWLPVSHLQGSLDLSGVGDLKHVYRSLSDNSLIISSGKKSGTTYKITGKGLDMAYDLICKLAKGEPINEN